MKNKKRRKQLIEEQGHCQLCGEDNRYQLRIHHQLFPKAAFRRDKRRNRTEYLTVLCLDCHVLYHRAVDIAVKEGKWKQ